MSRAADAFPQSARDQRARILRHLETGQLLTTLQARQDLNIMHPAARVQELRESGYPIATNWRTDSDSAGHLHRVAEYVLGFGGNNVQVEK
jgi:hypothetical protein